MDSNQEKENEVIKNTVIENLKNLNNFINVNSNYNRNLYKLFI